MLQVDPSATEKELKKAYKVNAMRCHPDKNLDDPGMHTPTLTCTCTRTHDTPNCLHTTPPPLDAAQKFQAMADAYQILADPVQRARQVV